MRLTDSQIRDIGDYLGHPIWYLRLVDFMPVPFCQLSYGESYICPLCECMLEWDGVNGFNCKCR